MQVRARPIVFLWLSIIIPACGSDAAPPTEVAVHNLGTGSIDATVSDGKAPLEFKAIAAGTTSTYQVASFASLSGIVVTVGSATSTVTLSEASGNIVSVAADGKVSGVTVAAGSGSGSSGW